MRNVPEIELKFKGSGVLNVKVTSSKVAYESLMQMYDSDTLECFESSICIFLNMTNKMIGWIKVSQGGITGTVIDQRIILAAALKCCACSFIVSHNHPSGNLIPSEADRALTKRIKEAGDIMLIPLRDHIIVTERGYFSFADEGLL